MYINSKDSPKSFEFLIRISCSPMALVHVCKHPRVKYVCELYTENSSCDNLMNFIRLLVFHYSLLDLESLWQRRQAGIALGQCELLASLQPLSYWLLSLLASNGLLNFSFFCLRFWCFLCWISWLALLHTQTIVSESMHFSVL